MEDKTLEIAPGPFAVSWESLREFRCPDWFRDAKLAFWSHWGPQSVPMYGDWYARNLYIEGNDQYRHHWRVYGHPSQHGYKDIIPLWKAEKFDPDGLMKLFVEAGAKYFVGQAMHHDNFDNFDSTHNRWNSTKIGPRKDICRMWQDAAKAHGLPFGLSEHLGASFNWWGTNKESDKSGPFANVRYEGCNPENADLYHRNDGCTLEDGWYTDNGAFQLHWFARIKDVIDKFQPDLIYSDGGVPFGEIGLSIIAHLYNTSAAQHSGVNQAVYNQKDSNPQVFTVGVLDVERGQLDDIAEQPWQTDTSVGDWFYNVRDVYKTPNYVLETLVDIVSKNGNLLLNIPQRPDGTLDDECEFLLCRMAKWMHANSEGLFGSRPWEISGEGESAAASGSFNEKSVGWSLSDFRFTRKNDVLYAFQMNSANGGRQAVIRSLALGKAWRVGGVRLLGQGRVDFEQTADGLTIKVPPLPPSDGPQGFAILPE